MLTYALLCPLAKKYPDSVFKQVEVQATGHTTANATWSLLDTIDPTGVAYIVTPSGRALLEAQAPFRTTETFASFDGLKAYEYLFVAVEIEGNPKTSLSDYEQTWPKGTLKIIISTLSI